MNWLGCTVRCLLEERHSKGERGVVKRRGVETRSCPGSDHGRVVNELYPTELDGRAWPVVEMSTMAALRILLPKSTENGDRYRYPGVSSHVGS